MYPFRKTASFYEREDLAPCPTSKSEDHPLSAVRYCSFNIFTTTLHIGGRSSNLRTRTAVVTGTHFSWTVYVLKWEIFRTKQSTDNNMARAHYMRYIPKATNAHLEYVIFIAFPQQQWLHKHATMLRYT